MEQKPSIGRIAHYVSFGTPGGEYSRQCRAAVITAVHDLDPVPEHGVPYVDLCVLNPTGMLFSAECKYDDADDTDKAGGTWYFPERV